VGSITITSLHVYCWVQRWKNFEYPSTCGKFLGKSRVSFLTHRVVPSLIWALVAQLVPLSTVSPQKTTQYVNLVRRFRIDTEVRCLGAHPSFGPWSRRGLHPIKPVYDPDGPDGRLNLTASAFNQLAQYTSSPGRRGYCYAELAVFFSSGGRNHRQYSLRLPTEGWPGWVGLGGWLHSEIVYLPEGSHPSQY